MRSQLDWSLHISSSSILFLSFLMTTFGLRPTLARDAVTALVACQEPQEDVVLVLVVSGHGQGTAIVRTGYTNERPAPGVVEEGKGGIHGRIGCVKHPAVDKVAARDPGSEVLIVNGVIEATPRFR